MQYTLPRLSKKTSQTVLLLAGMALASNAFAYKVGDKVDADVMQTLNIDKNKVTVVDFFASWCTSCKKELPLLNKMPIDKSKVQIIGVDTDKKLSKGQAFQKKLKITFPVYNDTNQTVVKKFAPFGMPALYYIKNGTVVKIRQGALPHIDKKVSKDLKKLTK